MPARENPSLATRWHQLAEQKSDFTAKAAAATWNVNASSPEVRADLSELVNRGLLMFDEKTWRYRMHDLLKTDRRRTLLVSGVGHSSQCS